MGPLKMNYYDKTVIGLQWENGIILKCLKADRKQDMFPRNVPIIIFVHKNINEGSTDFQEFKKGDRNF